jgi:hypothetical protein
MSALRLPMMDPREADLRQTVPAALNGRLAGGHPLRADLPRTGPATLAWFRCADDWAFAPERVAGEAVRLATDDGPAAAALLDTFEPALRQIELGLGVAIEPERVADAPPPDALLFRVERLAPARDRLWLAVPRAAALLPAAPEFAPMLLGGVSLPVTVTLSAPAVPPHDAAALSPGDLLLLGPGPLAATLAVAGTPARAGRFDPAAATFHS